MDWATPLLLVGMGLLVLSLSFMAQRSEHRQFQGEINRLRGELWEAELRAHRASNSALRMVQLNVMLAATKTHDVLTKQ